MPHVNKLTDALTTEIKRQAETSGTSITVHEDGSITHNGPIYIRELALAAFEAIDTKEAPVKTEGIDPFMSDRALIKARLQAENS